MAKRVTEAQGLFEPKKDGRTMYEEDALARAIGINRGRLHKGRARLDKGLWWYDHGRVAYTREGALAVMREVGVELPTKKRGGADLEGRTTLEDALASAEMGPPGEGVQGCQRLVVMRPALNDRIVMAGMLSDSGMPYGFACRVIVGSNVNFVKGMELRAVPVERSQYLYRMVGPLPRSFGRW
jgi:hypothetical protein